MDESMMLTSAQPQRRWGSSNDVQTAGSFVHHLVYRPVLYSTSQSNDRLLLRQFLRAYLSNTSSER